MLARYGMVHGRFQPFHNGHLEYALRAFSRSEHLIIGITNADPTHGRPEATDTNRHLPGSNPFTFFERQRMIRQTLVDHGICPDRLSMVPFPIHEPERWSHYCPVGTHHFVRVFSDWGREKVERLRKAAYEITILDEGTRKKYSGEDVRARIKEGQSLTKFLPSAVVNILREISARERLLCLD